MKIIIKNVIQFDIIRKFHEIPRKNYFLLEIIRYFKLSNSRQYLKYTNSLFFVLRKYILMYTQPEMLVNIIITKKSYQKYLYRTTIVVFVKALFYQKKIVRIY